MIACSSYVPPDVRPDVLGKLPDVRQKKTFQNRAQVIDNLNKRRSNVRTSGDPGRSDVFIQCYQSLMKKTFIPPPIGGGFTSANPPSRRAGGMP